MSEIRKLRGEDTEVLETKEPVMPSRKVVKTSKTDFALVDPQDFDLGSFAGMKPYNEIDPLPEPVIKTNRRGIRYLSKPGEPRFYFHGNELIKIYRGLSKKRMLFWTFRPLNNNGERNHLHIKIRNHLKKLGIPGA